MYQAWQWPAGTANTDTAALATVNSTTAVSAAATWPVQAYNQYAMANMQQQWAWAQAQGQYSYATSVPVASAQAAFVTPETYQAAQSAVTTTATVSEASKAPQTPASSDVQKPAKAKEELAGKETSELEKLNQLRAQAQQWTSQQQQSVSATWPYSATTSISAVSPSLTTATTAWPQTAWSAATWPQSQWNPQWAQQNWTQQPQTSQADVSVAATAVKPGDQVQKTDSSEPAKEGETLDDLDKEEQEFDRQFKDWEQQFEAWKKQNQNHPDKEAFAGYEKQWQEWRDELLRKKEEMRQERAKRIAVSKPPPTSNSGAVVNQSTVQKPPVLNPPTNSAAGLNEQGFKQGLGISDQTTVSSANQGTFYQGQGSTQPYPYPQPYGGPIGMPAPPHVVQQQQPQQQQQQHLQHQQPQQSQQQLTHQQPPPHHQQPLLHQPPPHHQQQPPVHQQPPPHLQQLPPPHQQQLPRQQQQLPPQQQPQHQQHQSMHQSQQRQQQPMPQQQEQPHLHRQPPPPPPPLPHQQQQHQQQQHQQQHHQQHPFQNQPRPAGNMESSMSEMNNPPMMRNRNLGGGLLPMPPPSEFRRKDSGMGNDQPMDFMPGGKGRPEPFANHDPFAAEEEEWHFRQNREMEFARGRGRGRGLGRGRGGHRWPEMGGDAGRGREGRGGPREEMPGMPGKRFDRFGEELRRSSTDPPDFSLETGLQSTKFPPPAEEEFHEPEAPPPFQEERRFPPHGEFQRGGPFPPPPFEEEQFPPDMGPPDMGPPDMGPPDMGRPDMGRPDMGRPDMGRPDMGRPGMGRPGMGRPDMGPPDMGRPDVGHPDMGHPDIGHPDMGRPANVDRFRHEERERDRFRPPRDHFRPPPSFEDEFMHRPGFVDERPPFEEDPFLLPPEEEFINRPFPPRPTRRFPPKEMIMDPMDDPRFGRDFPPAHPPPLNERFGFDCPDEFFPPHFPPTVEIDSFDDPGFGPGGPPPPPQQQGSSGVFRGSRFMDTLKSNVIDYTHKAASVVVGNEFSLKYDAFDQEFSTDLLNYRDNFDMGHIPPVPSPKIFSQVDIESFDYAHGLKPVAITTVKGKNIDKGTRAPFSIKAVFDYAHRRERSSPFREKNFRDHDVMKSDRSRDSFREKNRDNERDRARERDREQRERDRERNREKDRDFNRDKERDSERDKDLRDRDRDRYRERDRDKERDSKRGRDWDRDRDSSKDKENSDRSTKRTRWEKEKNSPDAKNSETPRKYNGERNRDEGQPAPSDSSTPASTQEDAVMKDAAEIASVKELVYPPTRFTRPKQLVIILRGLPGSGKTYVAKLIKDKEVEHGGCAPRILSLDDYFMVETEVTDTDPETGKKVKRKEFQFEYEECMEEAYRASLYKSFKKTIDDRFFPFIIVDATHEENKQYEQFWSYAKQRGFQVYIAEMDCKDPVICHKRNIHKRTLEDINKILKKWETKPRHFINVDVRPLLQDVAITEVEMEDTSESGEKKEEAKKDEKKKEEEEDEKDENSMPFHVPSRWEKLEATEAKLDQLDGLRLSKKKQSTMEDYLQLPDDYDDRPCQPGKKRVRWADLEERKEQERLRAIGFVVGQTDWSKLTDPSHADRALTRTKYF